MKKILTAIIILIASCQNQGEKVATREAVKTDTIGNASADIVINLEPKSTVPGVSKEKNSTLPMTRAKKAVKSKIPEETPPNTPPIEHHKVQPKADSTGIDQDGGGSDIEGYIPFIKQYFR